MPRAGGGSRPSSGSRSRSTGHRTSSSSRRSSSTRTSHRPSTSSSSSRVDSSRNNSVGGGPSFLHDLPPRHHVAPPPPPPRHMPPPPHRTVVYHHYDSTPRYDSATPSTTVQDTTVRTSGGSYYNSPTFDAEENAKIAKKRMIKKIIIWLVVFAAIFTIIGLIASSGKDKHNNSAPSNTYNQNYVENEKAPTVTNKKKKIDKSLCNETDYWSTKTDSLGYFDKSVESGLKTFYEKTGVQPYVMTVDISEVNKWDDDKAIEQYEKLFDDEGHFLMIIFGDRDGTVDWEYSWVTGFDAETVLDDEAMDVLWYYIDTYYVTDMSDSELFSKAFANTAKDIMK